MEKEFSKSLEDVKNVKCDDNQKLELYGLFKQIYSGDNNTSKPWNWDVKALYKWNAWNNNKGMSKSEAMRNYIDIVNKLKVKL